MKLNRKVEYSAKFARCVFVIQKLLAGEPEICRNSIFNEKQ